MVALEICIGFTEEAFGGLVGFVALELGVVLGFNFRRLGRSPESVGDLGSSDFPTEETAVLDEAGAVGDGTVVALSEFWSREGRKKMESEWSRDDRGGAEYEP